MYLARKKCRFMYCKNKFICLVSADIHKDSLTKAEQDRLAMPPPTTGHQISSGGTTKQDSKEMKMFKIYLESLSTTWM